MQVIVLIDQLREALRRNMVGKITEAGPELEGRIANHIIKPGRIELMSIKPQDFPTNELENICFPSADSDNELPNSEKNSEESGETDGYNLCNEGCAGFNSTGFGCNPDSNGHNLRKGYGKTGPCNGHAYQDAEGDNSDGGM